MKKNKNEKIIEYQYKLILIITLGTFGLVQISLAAPSISNISGTMINGNSVIINGSEFGSKANSGPTLMSNMEDGTLNSSTATNWESDGHSGAGYPAGFMNVSAQNQRSSNSAYNAVCNLGSSASGAATCAFTAQGIRSADFFIQYWWYGDSSDFSWGNGNNKIFRLWSSSENLRIQAPWNLVDVVVEQSDMNGGGQWYATCPPSPSENLRFWPSVPGGTCTDAVFGHSCEPDCASWLGHMIGWRQFATDMPSGVWHNFQFEYREGDPNVANGVLSWWADGRLVFKSTNLITRTTATLKYPFIVGIYPSSNNEATGHYYLDDVYIDTTWSRIEIGNNENYNSCTHRETQIPTAWNSSGQSATFMLNQGSFNDGDEAYIFLVDSNGEVSSGYPITIGAGGDIMPPVVPSGLSVS